MSFVLLYIGYWGLLPCITPNQLLRTCHFSYFTFSWLINLLFTVLFPALEFFTCIWKRHWWRAAKFSPMLGARGIWAGRDLYLATPAVTQGLGFSVSSEGPSHSVAFYDTQGCVENGSSQVPIQCLMTSKGVLKTYSYSGPLQSVIEDMPFVLLWIIYWGHVLNLTLHSVIEGMSFV
jgi:hypothetical protein